jgi:hypothetical protein
MADPAQTEAVKSRPRWTAPIVVGSIVVLGTAFSTPRLGRQLPPAS